ncbi:MAG: RNA polymerase factor sigma-54 [Proteobacteria bacterium]|jgi:RNA polymerase sigma-54 factor|nr:RNA polymerase factor sigma-54 [Pseudomonadota bacterium]
MKPTLQVRLTQRLALTPQLQQSIRLLQLSTLELHQEVAQMLDQNPFLESEEEPASPFESPLERPAADRKAEADGADTDGAADGDALDTSGSAAADGLAELRGEDFGNAEREDWANGTEGDDFDGIRETPAAASGGEGDEPAHEHGAAATTLAEHLRAQVVGMRLDDDERAALEALIESLDADGYLADALEEIGQRLADMSGATDAESRQALGERLRCALAWLQSLDPPGVGARDLGECLCLQLRARPKGPARGLALRIAAQHLEALAQRDLRRLGALTGASEELVREAQAMIVACEPRPARAFAATDNRVVVPDVIVRKSGRGLAVALNADVLPKLRINDLYARALRGRRGADGQAELGARLQEARWFMRNVQQRFETILRVAKAIVERQKGFFAHGAIAMKPLVLREIAEELGLHESTISRVTSAKYMATPLGTFELKYFFGSSLATEAGGSASSTAVRALIRQLVDAEDAAKPLSDGVIARLLEEQGIQVARRTVAKYREALKIAPANLRRAV